MDRDGILHVLRCHETELRRRGVRHIALFGSRARGEAALGSDIDLLVDIDPAAPIGVFEYVSLTHSLQALFPDPVDVANRAALKRHVQPGAERDAIDAF